MSENPLPSCCPLCDNAIDETDGAALYFAHGAKSLAHTACLEEQDESDIDEDD